MQDVAANPCLYWCRTASQPRGEVDGWMRGGPDEQNSIGQVDVGNLMQAKMQNAGTARHCTDQRGRGGKTDQRSRQERHKVPRKRVQHQDSSLKPRNWIENESAGDGVDGGDRDGWKLKKRVSGSIAGTRSRHKTKSPRMGKDYQHRRTRCKIMPVLTSILLHKLSGLP
jgi:hypothetical protein